MDRFSSSRFPMNDVRKLFNAELSAEHQTVLRQTRIDERLPGPLLTNIETLINMFGTGIQTTSAYFALPQRVLAELNEAMVDPMPHDLKRPQLRSFPTLTSSAPASSSTKVNWPTTAKFPRPVCPKSCGSTTWLLTSKNRSSPSLEPSKAATRS